MKIMITGASGFIGPRPLTDETFNAYLMSTQEVLITVRPRPGVGSIQFRGEQKLLSNLDTVKINYANIIGPHKGALEVWYVNNNTVKLYFICIFLTIIIIIISPKSRPHELILKELPTTPLGLK